MHGQATVSTAMSTTDSAPIVALFVWPYQLGPLIAALYRHSAARPLSQYQTRPSLTASDFHYQLSKPYYRFLICTSCPSATQCAQYSSIKGIQGSHAFLYVPVLPATRRLS